MSSKALTTTNVDEPSLETIVDSLLVDTANSTVVQKYMNVGCYTICLRTCESSDLPSISVLRRLLCRMCQDAGTRDAGMPVLYKLSKQGGSDVILKEVVAYLSASCQVVNNHFCHSDMLRPHQGR